MEFFETLGPVFEPFSLMMLLLGILIGMPVGAIPGLTATMTVAILLPITFNFEPLPGIMMLLGIYMSVMFSGAIPAILLNTPGTPSAAATVIEGYPLMKRGKGGVALSVSAISSGLAGAIGGVLLALFAPAVTSITRYIDSPVYFMLAVLGLVMVVAISERHLIKGLFSAVLGLMISFIGLDPVGGTPRLTFGESELLGGLSIVPLLIGLFGVSEAFRNYEDIHLVPNNAKSITRFMLNRKEWKQITTPTLSSSLIGFGIGVLPGVGGDIAGFVAYNETKRFAKDKSRFGKGDLRGLAAAEGANNSSSSGALVPTLTLGIPGDTVTAILIGAITVHGLRPGPQLFESSPELISGIYVSVILGSLIVIVIGLAGIRLWTKLVQVRPTVFWPVVLVLCVLGAYSFRASIFDVFVMLVAGLVGYAFNKAKIPLAPLVIGLILGRMMEENFGRALTVHGGSLSWMLEPVPLLLGLLAIASLVFSAVNNSRQRRKLDAKEHQIK